MILLDASGLLAALDVSQQLHEAARRVLEESAATLVLSPFVLAELDYLIARRIGVAASQLLLAEVEVGVYELAAFSADDIGQARRVIERYRDQEVGLADASLVVLADRLGTDRILTLDERHFRVLRTSAGQPFTLLPADA